MRYLSVCSGIEAASVAWHPLGWTPVGFSEIEPFPAAVLAHRFPGVPNFGDMTKYKEWPIEPGSIDVLVGGTPCQSFSVAGLRKGLADPRGNLMLVFLGIAERLRPRWIVWENVPGVLSSGGGRDFGSFLGALGELGYGWAYRVLDAQWCRVDGYEKAVPQRRRRVFVVGCLGEHGQRRAASVLLERESVSRDPEPRGEAGEEAASDAGGGAAGGRWWDGSDTAGTLTRKNAGGEQRMPDKGNFGAVIEVAHCLRGRPNKSNRADSDTYVAQPIPYDLFQITAPVNRQNRAPGDPRHTLARDNAAVVCTIQERAVSENPDTGEAFTLEARNKVQAVAIQACGDRDNPSVSVSDVAYCLPANAMSDRGQAVAIQHGADLYNA